MSAENAPGGGALLRVSFGPSAGVVADAVLAPHTEPAIGSQT